MKTQPLIKWTGSKRPIADKIVSYFPKEIKNYYEPFLGGGSVFFELLRSGIKVEKFVLSDKNESLTQILNLVKNNPSLLISDYEIKWNVLNSLTEGDDRNAFYYAVRDRYNKDKSPLDFYFLTRTCYNGTIRYNQKGEFNTSFHFGRPGMEPKKVGEIIKFYHELMRDRDISFNSCSFENVSPSSIDDVVYIDPPYSNSNSLYFGSINYETFFQWIKDLPCSWFLNFNGVNKTDNETERDFQYDDKVILKSGKSSFSRMKGQQVNVGEYFYYKKGREF